jgi:glutamyl/glutaminyl-tRNA synthetase
LAELTEKCMPFLLNSGIKPEEIEDKKWLEKVVSLEQERMSKLSDLPEAVGFIFAKKLEYDGELLIWKKSDKETTKNNLLKLNEFLNTIGVQDWNTDMLLDKIGEWTKENNLTNGEVLWPMRVALSGQKNSPSPHEIANVLGKEKALERIGEAISKL